ncbi:hypothetical protein VJ918_07690 [Adlercreutzia sp. R21]|uniref:hypothetical protein n=1 Tax=Adlercreutzia wanghongyangiae TaxID=3111451 RepID=UPI002DB64F03|nr:hypothetical protein [Adlercreutzia sp. R21]MEC4184687.1 hypothetical protein [Adlercreutzia sp. R21]
MGAAGETASRLWLDERFRSLVHCSTKQALSWDEFLRQPIPEGYTPEQVWLALCDVRHCGAVHIPSAHGRQPGPWYTPTLRISSIARNINARSGDDSPLSRLLRSPKGAHHRSQCQRSEILATAAQDGFTLSPDRAYDIVILKKKPRSVEERVIGNIALLMDSLEDYEEQPFSDDLADEFHRRITYKVDPTLLRSCQTDLSHLEDPAEQRQLFRRFRLEGNNLWAYANNATGEAAEDPVVKALTLRTLLSGYFHDKPFGTTLTRFIFSLFALKNHLTALAIAPFTQTVVAWIDANPRTLRHLFFEAEEPGCETDVANADITLFLEASLELAEATLIQLKEEVEREENELASLSSSLFEGRQLNRRQCTIVNYALRNPEAEMTIRYHQTNHRIAYATARADYLGLVEKGYLRQSYRGNAMVFTLDPTLLERLSTS